MPEIKIKNFIILLLFVCLLGVSTSVYAHKVNIFAYVEGNKVYTESYFSDGKKARGGLVEVYNSQGNKLLEGRTDKKGCFSFIPPKRDDLKIVIIASMGHKNFYILSKDELLADSIGVKELEPSSQQFTKANLGQFGNTISHSLDKKLKPIMRQLKKMEQAQRRPSLTEVIGGIGYIFGILGIVMYFLTKRKQNNASTRN